VCLGEVVRVRTTPVNGAVETDGSRPGRVSLLTLGAPVAVGDWLLVHSGFALARLTDAEARAALALRSGTTGDAADARTDARPVDRPARRDRPTPDLTDPPDDDVLAPTTGGPP
jgi:hydrogenase expression/formation protein HypC